LEAEILQLFIIHITFYLAMCLLQAIMGNQSFLHCRNLGITAAILDCM